MRSSSSDNVNQSIRSFVRAHPFFDFFVYQHNKVLYSIVSLSCRLQFALHDDFVYTGGGGVWGGGVYTQVEVGVTKTLRYG